jgi:hypothetical protein
MKKNVEAAPERRVSQELIAFFVHPCETAFPCSVGTFQSTPMSPSRVESNRKRFRANLTILLLRTVRVGFASPLMPLSVVIASKRFVAVAAEVLLLRLGLLFPDSSCLGAPGLLYGHLDRCMRGLLVGGGGSGIVFA